MRMRLSGVSAFRGGEIAAWARDATSSPAPSLCPMPRAASVRHAGCFNRSFVTGGGPTSAQHPAFIRVNTISGNIQRSFHGTYHHLNSNHRPRYLAEFYYRFNRRLSPRAMLPWLAFIALRSCLAQCSSCLIRWKVEENIEMSIVIKWDSGTEYLDINPDDLDVNTIRAVKETREWWPHEEKFVFWRVVCTLEEGNDDHHIFVKYARDQQDDENILKAIEGGEYDPQSWFGENKIIVTHDPSSGGPSSEGVCKWTCDVRYWSGQSRWKVMGRPRLRVTREQWKRESRFRENVLAEDEKCVISREPTPEVLDAAHLRPVKEGGEDLVENGLILRTDIHRLYDRGMFLISPDGTITINSGNLSEDYKQLLCYSQVPQATLERVREALQERLTDPQL